VETIIVKLIELGQLAIGLLYLLVLFLIGFIIADTLGFIAPLPGEEPSKRWLARQEPKPKSKPRRSISSYIIKIRLIYVVSILISFASGFLMGLGMALMLF